MEVVEVIGAVIAWTCVQYTGGWEDYAVLLLAIGIGMLCKHFKFSRAALIIGFVLADRLEASTISFFTLYDLADLLTKPIAMGILFLALATAVYGLFFNRSRIDYT